MNWIWRKGAGNYAEFSDAFEWNGGEISLEIGSDFKYAVFLNGVFAANGQYADLPGYKIVDKVDLSEFVRPGKNELRILAMHSEEDWQTCRSMTPAVTYRVTSGEKILAEAGEHTRARRPAALSDGDQITPQIGRSTNVSFTSPELPWETSVLLDTGFVVFPRPIPKTLVGNRVTATVTAQGRFLLRGGSTPGELLQNCWTSTVSFREMTGIEHKTPENQRAYPLTFTDPEPSGDGVFLIADLGRENAGYPFLSVTVEKDCTAYFGWGEHLTDLRVMTRRGDRNFAIRLDLKKGDNDFTDYLRRIGGRYFCLFVKLPSVTVREIGLIEERYPFKEIPRRFGDRLFDKMYEVGKYTLTLCAHEHYEDCPWREQALYGMDSRNQMLFGYGVFEEYELPRASLELFTKCEAPDGLLPMCPPADAPITIPSFSAYWLIAVYENALADRDPAFIKRMLPTVRSVLDAFRKNTENGTVGKFTDVRYWNFHEWSAGLDSRPTRRTAPIPWEGDAPLTALVLRAAKGAAELECTDGDPEHSRADLAYAEELEEGLERFYDPASGLYASYRDKTGALHGYHVYTQAAILTAKTVDPERAKAIREVIKHPEGRAVDITAGSLSLKYEALLADPAEREFVLNDLCRIFGGMLFQGATTFWETELGEADFHCAGSLCHGWSAIACYVLNQCFPEQNPGRKGTGL